MSDPDVELMLAFAKGREDAFVELYRRHRDRIVSFARRIVGSEAQAEEAAQEIFLKLYRSRDGYVARSRFSTFLYRIAVNHCLNVQARVENKLVQRGIDPDARAGSSAAEPHAQLENDELRTALRDALARLPERQRAALVLVHYEGLSYEEAAQAIDVSESALKSLIHRARTAMIEQLQPFFDERGALRHAV